MRYKELYGVRVYNIAKGFNITMVSVKDIIDTYVEECRNTLKCGIVLRIGDLATIRPSVVSSDYIPTLGYLCKIVSSKTGLPYYTVYTVVEAYLITVKEEILSGRSADIRKLLSFHSISLGDGHFKVNCALSASVRSDLRLCNIPMTARVSFSKSLRTKLKEVVL